MKKLTEAGNQYAKTSTWRDMALLKVCLCSMGVLIGLSLPARKKRAAAWAASVVLAATYVPLMGRFLPFLLGERVPIEDIYD